MSLRSTRVDAYGSKHRYVSQCAQWVPNPKPQTHPLAISSILECIIGIDILSSWQNFHIGSQTFWSEGYFGGKVKQKLSQPSLPKKQ